MIRSGRWSSRSRAVLVILGVVVGSACGARADDAAREFTPSTNNAGARWTYGWRPLRTGTLTLYANSGTSNGQNFWNHPTNQAAVYFNPTGAAITVPAGNFFPSLAISLFPGNAGQYSVVRWTAPVSGSFKVRARFTARNVNWAAKDVAVVSNGTVVFSAWLEPFHLGNTTSMSAVLPLTAGQTVEFAVGPADGSNAGDYVGLDATVNLEPPALGPAGPVLAFGGQRFVPCRWPGQAFESIAFDPIRRRLASEGDLSDLCGNRISDGPGEAPGLAWDQRTQTYWQITNTRVVRRWSFAGVLLDTVFTIPLTFTVPGWGLDTLESVRGIASDSNFVYVVDAGPNPGEKASNAWFKFNRTGVPVKSSKTTNLVATLDADPDALVDDIVYVPFSSPFMPGRLLIALEHSGIHAIDTEGNFVDKFLWSTQSLTPTGNATRFAGRLAAFAGLTIDPATGNLYLADNDAGDAQVWTRIANQNATSYVVGTIGSGISGVLQTPNPGCNLPLWGQIVTGPNAPSNFFGNAYRAADHAIYTFEFGEGDLWRFDARSGHGMRIGPAGVDALWGVAYDTERGVLYGSSEQAGGRRLVAIDPSTGAGMPLPNTTPYQFADLAFNSADLNLYGLDQSQAPTRLIRIDRDTGLGTVVGPTVSAMGLEYDASINKLIASSNSGRLFRITPATGVYDTLAAMPTMAGWEGLSVVPVPAAAPTVAVSFTEEPERDELRVHPNPARGISTLEFRLPRGSDVEVRVFDVAGRLLRKVASGHMASGWHRVDWDGRDASGASVPNGVYFARVEAGTHTMVSRITRMR